MKDISLYQKIKKKLEFSFKKVKKNLICNIKQFSSLDNSKMIEYPLTAITYLEKIANKIEKYNGALLMFDYGYNKKNNSYTLQAVQDHKHVDIFHEPGNSDITHHINYKLFSEILKKNKLKVEKVVTQNEFLQKMGIIERANLLSKKLSFSAKADIYYRLKKLLHYNEMGALFKVLLAKKKGNKFSLGF